MISLMVTETSTHNQVYYCHRNSKGQLDTDSNTSSQLATTLPATLSTFFPVFGRTLKLKFNFVHRKLKGASELSSTLGHNSKFNCRQI